MPDYDDLLNEIDHTLTSHDAMRCTPDADSPENEPESKAVLMTMHRAALMTLNRDDTAGHVAELVGDPAVDRVSFGVVDVWVGDNSAASGRHNPGNVLMVKPLLRAMVSGDIAASDAVRDHVRELLATDTVPDLYGPVLITGPLDENNLPTNLPEAVVNWLDNRARERITGHLEALLAALVGGEVSVVVLGED